MNCCFNRCNGDVNHSPGCLIQPAYMSYPDGMGDVRFHYFDGRTFILKRVQFDSIGSGSAECMGDLTGEFEDGEIFHVPNVAWWEVVYLP